MHWWQIVIRLLLIANIYGNVSKVIRAGRERHRTRLQWLIPRVMGWVVLFFGLLPARWGGFGPNHSLTAVGISIALLSYAIIIEITDVSHPPLPVIQVEVPHLGSFGTQQMFIIAILGFLLVGWDILQKHYLSSNDKVLLIAFSLGLLFGIRLLLRQLSLTRCSDLAEFAKLRPHPPEKHEGKPRLRSGEE